MERRKDYRHALRYTLTLKCPKSRRVIDGVSSNDVSASGLRFRSDVPHGLETGERLEIQLVARVPGELHEDLLVMATRAEVVWVDGQEGALRFETPLTY